MKSKRGILLVIILILLLIGGITVFMLTKKDNNSSNNEENIQETKTGQTNSESEKQNVNLNETNNSSNTSEQLKKVDSKDYTTVTYGKYGSYDKTEMPVGSTIKAYPLSIEEILSKKIEAIKYGELYKGEWIVVTGYVHYQKEGFFVIAPSNSEDVKKYVGTIVAEDKNIKADYNWNIKDGDYITIAGLCKGTYNPSSNEYYIVMNDVFVVK